MDKVLLQRRCKLWFAQEQTEERKTKKVTTGLNSLLESLSRQGFVRVTSKLISSVLDS